MEIHLIILQKLSFIIVFMDLAKMAKGGNNIEFQPLEHQT